ncbi:membrane protein [Caballeronia catudaia]|uniref:Membrane protein n=1 Tax=Caballeronia catudaia TaxID=1777136 RepID=A0A158AAQ7_9BURK|nr:membrane protein [Caballeronia catudaia]
MTAIDPRAQAVLDFWFDTPGSLEYGVERKLWWKKKRAFDAMLAERFGALLEEAHAGGLRKWEETPLGMLALIVLLDQFSRNCYRNTPRAFAGDSRALELARRLVECGDDLSLPGAYHRAFAYMPFEHDETLESQREALRLFGNLKEEMGVSSFYESAVEHAEVIERFGRFPHRNRILGRAILPDEEAWLAKHGGF